MGFVDATGGVDSCVDCGFALWEPIAASTHSRLGLYNDDRFPGRCILMFRDHFESLDQLPMDSTLGFVRDIQLATRAIKKATGAARVNISLLGNRDPHLHAHLVPRFPHLEQFPDSSPWNDLRVKDVSAERVELVKGEILDSLLGAETRVPTRWRAGASAGALDDLARGSQGACRAEQLELFSSSSN